MKLGVVVRLAALVVLIAFLVAPEAFAPVFAPLTKNNQLPIYQGGKLTELRLGSLTLLVPPLLSLTLNHLAIVFAATVASTLVAVGLAVLVTRPVGAEFLPLSRSLANIGQTFPPVAVLAIAVPILGFGPAPTLVALFLYGLLPIFENALTGLTTLPPAVTEAARGMGMTETQRLWSIELPLALPVMLAGIRLSAVIALSTATIGSTVAASTLGEVIIAGLVANNVAWILQGGLVVGILAVLIYDGLAGLERLLMRRTGQAKRV
jgi:osmoprotectant transport system permease protein